MRNTFLWLQAHSCAIPLPGCRNRQQRACGWAKNQVPPLRRGWRSGFGRDDKICQEGGTQRLNPPVTNSTGEFLAHHVGITGE
jgi:hypothetical protein